MMSSTTLFGLDGSTTPLGPPTDWPQSLRSIVALILASGKPMFIVWGASRTLIYNDAYVPLLGHRHPQAFGRPFFEVWPQTLEELGPLFDRLFGASVVDVEDISISFDREEGAAAHFALSYTPIRDQGNTVVGLLCIHSETTDAVPGPVLPAIQHARLARMFETAPSFIAVLNGAEHRIELVSAALLKLLRGRDIIGRTVQEALPGAVTQGYLALLDEAFKTGDRVVRDRAPFLRRAPRTAPQECFVDFVFQPITDGIGQVTGIFVHGTDGTERVLHERVLRDRETHLHEENADLGRLVTERSVQLLAKEALIQAVYDHSSEFHVVLAEAGPGMFRVDAMNPAAMRVLAVDSGVLGRTVEECLPADAARVAEHLAACLKALAPQPFEVAYRGCLIEGIASPLPPFEGVVRQIAVSARDVTERRNLEEQLRQSQKMEAVGQLTGGLAHDFNNLLSGISGSLELLKVRTAQSRFADLDRLIDAAQGAAQRAGALTHRLLAFARRQTLDPQSVDVGDLVGGMDELVRRTVGPSIRVAVVRADPVWRARVDRNQLENALLNLCLNARDAMQGGGELVMETANHWIDERAGGADLPPGPYVSLTVRDTGHGMPPEVMARAFEPFYTTKAIGEGTGLGLSMIYGFARQSGGAVRMHSAVGHGTSVQIFLPRHLNDADAASAAKVAAPLPMGKGQTVLVVDDEPTVRMLTVEMVRDLGYRAIEAADGHDGLAALEAAEQVDLLVTDIGLPGGMDGLRLGEAARARRPGLRILYITGYGDVPIGRVGGPNPGLALLAKPFAMRELAERIGMLMRADQ